MAMVTDSGLELYPLTLERYEQMVERGVLGPDDKVELLRGVLSAVTPQGEGHYALLRWLTVAIVRGTDLERLIPVTQLPLWLPATQSVPEPDVAVVAIEPDQRPGWESAVLVVEVSASSLRKDRTLKAGIYAESGIPEYWIVDVARRVVHVQRRPDGDRYAEIATRESGTLTPLAEGAPAIDLDALFAQLDRPGLRGPAGSARAPRA